MKSLYGNEKAGWHVAAARRKIGDRKWHRSREMSDMYMLMAYGHHQLVSVSALAIIEVAWHHVAAVAKCGRASRRLRHLNDVKRRA